MYQFELSNVSVEQAYPKALQLMEDISSQFHFQDYEGIFSMSLYEIFSAVKNKDQQVDIEYLVDNQRVVFNISFSEQENVLENLSDESAFILSKITDDFSYDIDNKIIAVLFHVKRQPVESRFETKFNNKEIEALLTKMSYEN